MGLTREQIENQIHGKPDKRHNSRYRGFLKRCMNKWIRQRGKRFDDDEIGGKTGRKPCSGWEW